VKMMRDRNDERRRALLAGRSRQTPVEKRRANTQVGINKPFSPPGKKDLFCGGMWVKGADEKGGKRTVEVRVHNQRKGGKKKDGEEHV